MKEQLIVVMVSVPSLKVARALSQVLVVSKAAACVSIIPGTQSFYFWQGRMEKSKELLLLVKTRRKHWKDLCRMIEEKHPYEVPEIIAWPVLHANETYSRWVYSQTRKNSEDRPL